MQKKQVSLQIKPATDIHIMFSQIQNAKNDVCV